MFKISNYIPKFFFTSVLSFLMLLCCYINIKNVYAGCTRIYPPPGTEPNYYCANYEADWCEDSGDCSSTGNWCAYDTRCSIPNPNNPYACQRWSCEGTCSGTCGPGGIPPGDDGCDLSCRDSRCGINENGSRYCNLTNPSESYWYDCIADGDPGEFCCIWNANLCDDCCVDDDDDDPEPNNWYGVYGRVWSDFNNNGTRDEGEDWKGLPQYDTDGRCAPTTHQQDFSVIVNGENIARAWWCVGTPRIHTTRFEYYSHHDDAPGWVGLNAGMSRGNYYTATLGNMPSGSSCGTWTVYNSDGSLQGNGAGCDASFLFTTVNNYMVIDWKLGPAGCTSNSDCNDDLFCTDDVCNTSTGQCTHPVHSCNDSNACTTDSCDETNDRCVNTNVPVNGALGSWGNCSNGSQSSSCSGYSCGGSCSAECIADGGTYNSTNHTCTRPCLYMEGNIWNDEFTVGTMMSNELWRGDASLSCDDSRYFGNFNLAISGLTGNQIKSWWCHSGLNNRAYYRTTRSSGGLPVYADLNIKPESTLSSVSLKSISLPPGYECGSWDYQNSLNLNEKQGTGCTATNLVMPTAGWTNVHFKLKCQNTSWGPWSATCVNGVQTRTCNNPDPVCQAKYCLGSSTRPCLRIDGNIWSDDDRDGKELSDYWKKGLYTPSGCSTSKTFPNFSMSVSGETPLNQISEWWCHPSGYGVYFNTLDDPPIIEPESIKTASLTNIPAAYDVRSWEYRYLKDGITTSQTGLGSVASNLLMPPYANWVNLHWELKQQTYNLTINVQKILPEIKPIDLPSRCGEPVIYDGALQGAQITVTDADDTANVVCSGTSNSDGNLTCPIWILQGALNITATKSVGGLTPETYSLQCPNSNVYVYNPNPSPVKGDSRTADIGLQTGYKDGWVSAIDSDIFAGRLNVIVPAGPTDNLNSGQTPQGFAKTLINSSGNTDRYLGFAFSETGGVSNSPNDSKKIFETRFGITLGGNAYNLRGNSKEHDSEWLKNFTFTPPSGAVQLSTIGNSFKANTVYKISQDDHGTIELPNSYRITDGTGVSILYFEGDLVIRNNVTNITPGNGRLLVIVNGSVTISESVGTTLTYPAGPTNYMSQDPHIMVGIIASEEIIFKSISGTKTETNRDKMIMVSAPLIAKNSMNSASGITFGRDLYHDNNATMPAESAKVYNKYLYLLTSLEREKSQDNLYFTGVTTYDLDWEYIY